MPLNLTVTEGSQVGEARRRVAKLAGGCGWQGKGLGSVELVVTELAKNLVKHAEGGGEIIVWPESDGQVLTVLALDAGTGIRNVSQALADGYSTAGSPGTGLGAVRRISAEFDLYSRPDKGAALMARLERAIVDTPPESPIRVGGLRLPMASESSCGDGFAWGTSRGRFLAFLVDGLGHGVMAAEVADAAVRTFRKNLHLPPDRLLESVHLALRSTRGGVAAVAELSEDRKQLNYAGIGNITAVLQTAEGERNLVSYNGTLGQEVRKFQSFSYPWTADTMLVMHSDGLSNRWDFSAYAGLERKPPALVAGVLYRDHARKRDDQSVLVVKECRK